jgi:hypothetical protein
MSDRAEFRIEVAKGNEFFASWPKDADPRRLRAVGAMLAELLNWWANDLEQQPKKEPDPLGALPEPDEQGEGAAP